MLFGDNLTSLFFFFTRFKNIYNPNKFFLVKVVSYVDFCPYLFNSVIIMFLSDLRSDTNFYRFDDL